MSDPFELRQTWDQIHRTKPASELPDEDLIAFIEQVSPRLSSGALLLDAGCGRGRNTLCLSRSGFEVCACDLSPAALGIAKGWTQRMGISVSLQAADLARLPYASDSFAAVVCVHVLPYRFKINILAGLHELWRVLQPKGWLYLDLLDQEDAEYGCGQRLEADTFLEPDGLPVHFSSRQEIDELMNGFEIQRLNRIEKKPAPDRTRVIWTIWATKEQAPAAQSRPASHQRRKQ